MGIAKTDDTIWVYVPELVNEPIYYNMPCSLVSSFQVVFLTVKKLRNYQPKYGRNKFSEGFEEKSK